MRGRKGRGLGEGTKEGEKGWSEGKGKIGVMVTEGGGEGKEGVKLRRRETGEEKEGWEMREREKRWQTRERETEDGR